MLNKRFFVLLGIMLSAAAMRLVPHPPNITPIAAMALFGGVHFASKRTAFLLPLAAMYLSDLALGFFIYDFGWFHGFMPFVYTSFVVTVCLGFLVRHRLTPLTVGGAALMGSVLFFIVTNLGVWLVSNLYPKTLAGLVSCYVAAIPFFRNTFVGDAVYTLVLFGGFALAQRYLPVLRGEPVAMPAYVCLKQKR
ncbi:MAG: DUF6580 family putative transport protein [Planctomycetota bacterium]|nr:DUF6580 family putative transport protein [Planctomycetota bacterium]